MELHLRHVNRFTYDRPVFLEPLTVRLKPRSGGGQVLLSYRLAVEPEPAGRCDGLDANGNDVTTLWFEGVQTGLVITTHSVTRTLTTNPFDYLLTDPGMLTLPVRYEPHVQEVLGPYLQRKHPGGAVAELVDELAGESQSRTLDYLNRLVSRVQQRCRTVIRPEGPAWPPDETLARGQGACRDLAVLFIDACRSVGIAARFVSGYTYTPMDDQAHCQLHAWAEVYLPGAGWRGYDPSLGLATADAHIAVACAPDPTSAAATTGTFRGTSATARLNFHIDIQADQPSGKPNPTT